MGKLTKKGEARQPNKTQKDMSQKLSRKYSASFYNIYVLSSSDSSSSDDQAKRDLQSAYSSPFIKFRKCVSLSTTNLGAKRSNQPITKSRNKEKMRSVISLNEGVIESEKTLSSSSTDTLTKIRSLWQESVSFEPSESKVITSELSAGGKTLPQNKKLPFKATDSLRKLKKIKQSRKTSGCQAQSHTKKVGHRNSKREFSVGVNSSDETGSSLCSGDYSCGYNTSEIRHSLIRTEVEEAKTFSVDTLSFHSIYVDDQKIRTKFQR